MARRLIHYSSEVSGLEEIELLSNKNDEVIVKAIVSGVSLATEKKVALGQMPVKVSELMRVPYMSGDFSFPLSYGYSMVGQVIEGDKDWLGKRVHLMHPHQNFCVVKEADLMEIPKKISDSKATLISNMETALNGFWDGRILQDDRILIIGFGLIGALLSGVLKINTRNKIQIFE